MSAPPQRLIHGSLATPVMTDYRVRRSTRDLDRAQFVMMCDRRGMYNPGGVSPMFPNLRIQDVEERNVAGDVEVTLDCEGLIDTNSKRTDLVWSEDPFGFDVAREERVVVEGSIFTWGAALSGFANMRLLGVGERANLDNRWARRGLEYRGIKKAGLCDRRVTVNENIVNPAEPVVVGLGGGWADPRPASISLPRVVLMETVKSTVEPATSQIPDGNLTVPISGFAFPSVQTFSLSGTLTYNWPNGWKLASIDSVQLYAGVGIYVNTYTYEYVWLAQF